MQQPGHLKKGKNFMYSTKLHGKSYELNDDQSSNQLRYMDFLLYITLLDHIFFFIIPADTTTLFTCYKILHAHIPCNSIYV